MLWRACSSRGRIFPFFLPMQSYSFILFLLQSPDDASAAIKDISAFYNFRHTDYLPGILLLLSVGEKKKKVFKNVLSTHQVQSISVKELSGKRKATVIAWQRSYALGEGLYFAKSSRKINLRKIRMLYRCMRLFCHQSMIFWLAMISSLPVSIFSRLYHSE